jgi:dipeptidyl aminopeptidase/acylaminoacyl peptidase
MSEEDGVVTVLTVPGEMGMTPDLRRVALTNWRADFSAIGVCDLETGSAEVLRAGKKATLRMPALSPDGETIAFVAQPVDPRLQGLSSLYLAPVSGGEVRRIGVRATYSAPSFSSDGERILVFAGDEPWGSVQPVEISLNSGAERLIWSGAFSGVYKAAYDPGDEGYWVGGLGPAASLAEATSWASIDYDTKHGSPRVFRILREDEAPRPFSVNPDGPAVLVGVTQDEVVIQTFALETGFRALLVNRKGEVRRLWRSPRGDDFPDGWAVSADAKRVLAVRMQRDDADQPLGKYELTVFETGSDENGRVLSRVLSSDLRATFHELNLP